MSLAVQVLKLVNTKQARKYHDKLYSLQLKKMNMDAKRPDEVDDVAYVKILKEIDLTAKAALNDPAIVGSQSNPK